MDSNRSTVDELRRAPSAWGKGRTRLTLAVLLGIVTVHLVSGMAFAWQENEPAESAVDALREPAPPAANAAERLRLFDGTEDLASIPTRLSEMFVAGGPLMWPIGLCSLIAFTFALERLVVLRRRRVIPGDFVRRFLDQMSQGLLDRDLAAEVCQRNGSPIAQVLLHGVRKWGKTSVEIEQAIIDGGERQVGHLRKHLRVLNSVGTIAPQLGLLGTVFGMIRCFNQISTSSAMGKSEQLAGGIGEALLTTAFGLTVAIPALVFYSYFAGRIDALVMEMDDVSQKLVDVISAEAIAERAAQPPRSSPPRPKSLPAAASKAT